LRCLCSQSHPRPAEKVALTFDDLLSPTPGLLRTASPANVGDPGRQPGHPQVPEKTPPPPCFRQREEVGDSEAVRKVLSEWSATARTWGTHIFTIDLDKAVRGELRKKCSMATVDQTLCPERADSAFICASLSTNRRHGGKAEAAAAFLKQRV